MHSLAQRLLRSSSPRYRHALCLAMLFVLCPLAAADTRLAGANDEHELLATLVDRVRRDNAEALIDVRH